MPNVPAAPAQPATPITHGPYGSFHQVAKGPSQSALPGTYAPVPVAQDLQGGITGVSYSEQISAQGGVTPYSFAVTGGALPTGTSMTSAGLISGTPSVAATFNFTVTVTDSQGNTGSTAFQIIIASPAGGGAGNYGFVA